MRPNRTRKRDILRDLFQFGFQLGALPVGLDGFGAAPGQGMIELPLTPGSAVQPD
jgi:hypothetical protein